MQDKWPRENINLQAASICKLCTNKINNRPQICVACNVESTLHCFDHCSPCRVTTSQTSLESAPSFSSRTMLRKATKPGTLCKAEHSSNVKSTTQPLMRHFGHHRTQIYTGSSKCTANQFTIYITHRMARGPLRF